jgi:RIP metalloprotease RseP
VLLAGAFMNYVLAVLLIITCFFAYGQTMVAVYEINPTDEFAKEFCLHDRDIFYKVNGKNIYMQTDVARVLNGKKKGDFVNFELSRIVDRQTEIDGETGEEVEVKVVRERMTVRIMLRSDVTVKNSSDLNSVWDALGVAYKTQYDNEGNETGKYYQLANGVAKFGFFETIGRAFAYSGKIAGSIFRVLGELLTGKIGISSLGGPVTTITTTSKIVSMGFRYFLEIAGFIGVNLAVFNLLPIPALDGSKVVFTLIEWVRGKPISRKVEAIIHGVGFILLLGFAVLVDILQFVL